MWVIFICVLALLIAIGAGYLSTIVWLRFSTKVDKSDMRPLLEKASEEVCKEYSRQFRSLELDWNETFTKLQKIAGRIDKERALQKEPDTKEPEALTRSDLIRRRRINV